MNTKRTFSCVCLCAAHLFLMLTGAAHAQTTHEAGLWVGTVSLANVTDPKGGVTPAGGVFEFRILFHVNKSGEVKLLKDVIIMQRDDDNNAATAPVIVLVNDPAKIPLYSGVQRRTDGRSAGIRYAASAYDFAGLELAATGSIGSSKTLSFTLDMAESHPTNPFRHKFHSELGSGRTYSRVVNISFPAAASAATASGTKRLTGTYSETLKKLVKYDIQMTGTVTLDLVSTSEALNP